MRSKNGFVAAAITICVGWGIDPPAATAQLTANEIAKREYWEEFLKTAEIIDEQKMTGPHSVTDPYRLTLKKGDIVADGCWKKVKGRKKGNVEGWQWEVAAYQLDKYLGLNMVPPVVERKKGWSKGSLCLWMDVAMTLREQMANQVEVPADKLDHWNKQSFKQRMFDNLIGNIDRNRGNTLITKDWRIYLIDHSLSFGTSDRFDNKLQYDENHQAGAMVMEMIPRHLYEKVKSLDEATVKEAVGKYLTKKERQCLLKRRDLVIAALDKRIAELGEEKVLY